MKKEIFSNSFISGKEAYNYLLELVKIAETGKKSSNLYDGVWGIIAGSKQDRMAANFVMEKFKEFGLSEVRFEPYPVPLRLFEKWGIEIFDNSEYKSKTFACLPLYSTQPNLDKEIIAEAYYLDIARIEMDKIPEKKIKGKIILLDTKMSLGRRALMLLSLREVINKLIKAGAVGYVAMYDHPAIPWGAGGPLPRIETNCPGVSIGCEDSIYLKQRLCSGSIRIKLLEKVKTVNSTTANVIGVLPGKSKEIILIGGHLDGYFSCAIDNCSGIAGLLSLAKYYSEIPRRSRKKTMVFVAFAAHHEPPIMRGSTKFVNDHPEILNKTVIFINSDHLAATGYEYIPGGELIKTGFDEKRALFVSNRNPLLLSFAWRSIVKYQLFPMIDLSEITGVSAAGDARAFVGKVPFIWLAMAPIWYHSPLDTPDKLTPGQLERAINVHIEIINYIQSLPGELIRRGSSPENAIKSINAHKKRNRNTE